MVLYVRLDTKKAEKDLHQLAGRRDQPGRDVQLVRVIKDTDVNALTSEESVKGEERSTFTMLCFCIL